jgi:hypothetical protein
MPLALLSQFIKAWLNNKFSFPIGAAKTKLEKVHKKLIGKHANRIFFIRDKLLVDL